MEELAFHRKYRAKNLNEYIGNRKIVSSMLGVLRSGKRPQVILLEGHAGCGKTTFARLIAKEYMCENRNDEMGACGVCDSCKEIEEFIRTGNTDMLMNVREIDNSVSGNKQDIDELLNEAEMPSPDGNWKVYILDECHLLSAGAQGRLLKMLEEPPEKVLMILCTTDPDKLLNTILSRCQYRFKVTKPNLTEMTRLLKGVTVKEGVISNDKSLAVIASASDFVPRDALILLEQVVNERKEVTYENVTEVLNVVADTYYFKFYDLLLAHHIDIFRYVKFVSEIKEAMDLRQFITGLLTFTERGIYIFNGVNLEGIDLSEIKRYKKIFSRFSSKDIVNLLNFLINMKDDDIETKLLMLGYKGILGTQSAEFTQELMEDRGNSEIGEEKLNCTNSFVESQIMTEDEKEDLVKEGSQTMSLDELATLFGGEVVV